VRLWLWLATRAGRLSERFDERGFLKPGNARVQAATERARRAGAPISVAPPRLLGSGARFIGLQWADYGPLNHLVRARHGIQLRDPLGARRVLELSLSLGPEHFYREGQGRRLSKALLKGRVPEAVIGEDQRRGIQGGNWLTSAIAARAEMRREVDAIEDDAELAALVDADRMRQRLDDWPEDGWTDIHQGHVYRDFLTTTIAVARFARRVRERNCRELIQ
jgi:hypothetical protein